ncbi:methionyl-tRNA formyltransferase, partial [Clostridium perfringens]|uniref:methionyl-tRNA formyltransferase n=1 Tax=Clostridium perfringens TaxID=1502 RepID=UPI002AC50EAB|nr:methionyl-tRNA formyltransferase [Clostridium perfringens]
FLMNCGADLLINTIEGLVKGKITPEKQSEETFYAKMLNKELGKINWNNSAKDIHNLIRGLNPWPIAHTTYDGKSMKIYESKILSETSNKEPGTIISVSKEGMKVSTSSGVLLLKKIQFPNGKPLTIEQYI